MREDVQFQGIKTVQRICERGGNSSILTGGRNMVKKTIKVCVIKAFDSLTCSLVYYNNRNGTNFNIDRLCTSSK